MNNDKRHNKRKKFCMPWEMITIISFLMMPFSMFVLDSPIMFWLSFLFCTLGATGWSIRIQNEMKGGTVPWWWGGL